MSDRYWNFYNQIKKWNICPYLLDSSTDCFKNDHKIKINAAR